MRLTAGGNLLVCLYDISTPYSRPDYRKNPHQLNHLQSRGQVLHPGPGQLLP